MGNTTGNSRYSKRYSKRNSYSELKDTYSENYYYEYDNSQLDPNEVVILGITYNKNSGVSLMTTNGKYMSKYYNKYPKSFNNYYELSVPIVMKNMKEVLKYFNNSDNLSYILGVYTDYYNKTK